MSVDVAGYGHWSRVVAQSVMHGAEAAGFRFSRKATGLLPARAWVPTRKLPQCASNAGAFRGAVYYNSPGPTIPAQKGGNGSSDPDVHDLLAADERASPRGGSLARPGENLTPDPPR